MDRTGKFSDDSLWLPKLKLRYSNETGRQILRMVFFRNLDKLARSVRSPKAKKGVNPPILFLKGRFSMFCSKSAATILCTI